MVYVPHLLLSLAVLLLWLKSSEQPILKRLWLIAFCVAIGMAFYLKKLELIALTCIIIFGIVALAMSSRRLGLNLRLISGVVFVIISLLLGLHLVPGFNPDRILHNEILSADALPYTLYLNIDKAVVGIFILGFFYQKTSHSLSWKQSGRVLLLVLPVTILVVVSLSLLTGYVRLDLKIINKLWLWIWLNLFFTCMTEEAFFRGFLQHQLNRYLEQRNYSKWIAPIVVALLFGLAHFSGGVLYIVIATAAGLGYGIIYMRTGRIETSIIAHFILNLTHVLLFTYPALKV